MSDPSPAPSREQLIYLLTEAAELEHGLMCSYLFASFSLRRAHEGLTLDESAKVESWRASIRSVAIEEMLHLALVQNVLLALGGAPHLQRPNFPVTAGIYPSGLALRLRRLDAATLDHFVYLERPEGMMLEDGEGYERPVKYQRDEQRPGRVTASADEYESVAQLYRGIEDGLTQRVARDGEECVFVGERRAQVDSALLKLDGLDAVTNLVSARSALDRIIEQGEGGRTAGGSTSHFDRFQTIRDEYRQLSAARPGFDPARPVAESLVMHRPLNEAERTYVNAPQASAALDVGNAVYGLMVQLLARFFSAIDDDDPRRILGDVAITLMSKAVAPIAELLTTLPATADPARGNAGLTFSLPRSTHALPQRRAAWTILRERMESLAEAAQGGLIGERVPAVATELAKAAAELARGERSVFSSAR